MSWLVDWKAISYRIKGLLEAGQYFALVLANRDSDAFGVGKQLYDQASDIYKELEIFLDQSEHILPEQAYSALSLFLDKYNVLFTQKDKTSRSKKDQYTALLTMLATLDSEISFHLSDSKEHIRRRSERAFAHLQRLIVADSEVQKKWQNAFNQGEVACEKLGGAHLLLHGIWAFKADAKGARTDLVFGDLLDSIDKVERTAEGLVLTEWKRAKDANKIDAVFSKARKQAARYACGMLAGIELASYRYAVVVSEQRIEEPEDIHDGDVIYKHINIAVNPQTPSKG